MRVLWSPSSKRDVAGIFDYIHEHNPQAARAVAEAIRQSCHALRQFPNRGRPGVSGTRELVITSFPYIVIYRVRHDAVEIARVFHAAQNFAAD